MSEPKAAACPFCGGETVAVFEGETFRWLYATCAACEARGPAVRRGGNWNEISELDRAEVFAEWNRRSPLATDRERRLAEAIVYLLGPAEGPDWSDATADSILNEARALLAELDADRRALGLEVR